MTSRSKTPQAASGNDADVDDAQTSVTDIDDLIVRLRAAYDRGTPIEELHARLGLLPVALTPPSSEKRAPIGFPSPSISPVR